MFVGKEGFGGGVVELLKSELVWRFFWVFEKDEDFRNISHMLGRENNDSLKTEAEIVSFSLIDGCLILVSVVLTHI